MHAPSRRFLCLAAALGLLSTSARALEDSAPIDIRSALEALKTIKTQQAAQMKTLRQRAIQDAMAAASNPAKATELWEEAVRSTQFHGASKEGAAWREWKEKEGDALKDRVVQNALHLYFNWLALTLKHADGVSIDDLLPAVQAHVKDAIADEAAMDDLEDVLKKEREGTPGVQPRKAGPRDREKKANDGEVKKMHDDIAKQAVTTSLYAEWLGLGDMLQDVAPAQARTRRGQAVNKPGERKRDEPEEAWEGTPGNVDGIFNNIIMPALRDKGDPHVVDYWDYVLRHEGDKATRTKLQFEIDKYNQIRRPQLLWARNQELVTIGLKNRAAAEMLALIKANPSHPDVQSWIGTLEALIVPANPPAASTAPSISAGTPAAPAR